MSKANIPGIRSQNQLVKIKKTIANANYSGLYGISIEKGKGCFLYDIDGNKYLDCLAAASTNCLGYSNRKIIKTYTQTARKIQHSLFAYSPNKYALILADQLLSVIPWEFNKRVMFGLSGSDACDGAIKAARKFTGKKSIIHFKNDYHGSTGLAMPASDYSHLNEGLFKPDELFLELTYPRNLNELEEALAKIESFITKGTVAAVIAEPIQGDAGIHIPPHGFFKQLRACCSKHNVVLIIDEIQSGLGRTGKWWAIEHENIEPDILVTAKGLSGGYAPVSAIVGRTEILNSLSGSQHVFTYSGHAPSVAVAAEVVKTIKKKQFIITNKDKGDWLINELLKLKTRYSNTIVDVRGRGLMIGVEINLSNDSKAGKYFATRCVELGLYVGFFGVNGEVVRIEPPYSISNKQLKKVVSVIDVVANEMENNKIPDYTKENVSKYSQGL